MTQIINEKICAICGIFDKLFWLWLVQVRILNMEFERWIRKHWYIPLTIIFFSAATLQFISDTFGISFLGRFGAVIGILVAWMISYVLYKQRGYNE
jgi:hypothetical protein